MTDYATVQRSLITALEYAANTDNEQTRDFYFNCADVHLMAWQREAEDADFTAWENEPPPAGWEDWQDIGGEG